MIGWLQVKEEGVEVLLWWKVLVKKGIKELAFNRYSDTLYTGTRAGTTPKTS